MKLALITFFFVLHTAELPDVNRKIVEYVDTVIGKKVGRGECWDLASAAMNHADAFLDRSSQETIYVFGKEIDPDKVKVLPGDIIQFENVRMEYARGNAVYTETMLHHTAIVYELLGQNYFKLAHQNTSFSGKKVGISEFALADVKKGDVIIYRPFRK